MKIKLLPFLLLAITLSLALHSQESGSEDFSVTSTDGQHTHTTTISWEFDVHGIDNNNNFVMTGWLRRDGGVYDWFGVKLQVQTPQGWQDIGNYYGSNPYSDIFGYLPASQAIGDVRFEITSNYGQTYYGTMTLGTITDNSSAANYAMEWHNTLPPIYTNDSEQYVELGSSINYLNTFTEGANAGKYNPQFTDLDGVVWDLPELQTVPYEELTLNYQDMGPGIVNIYKSTWDPTLDGGNGDWGPSVIIDSNMNEPVTMPTDYAKESKQDLVIGELQAIDSELGTVITNQISQVAQLNSIIAELEELNAAGAPIDYTQYFIDNQAALDAIGLTLASMDATDSQILQAIIDGKNALVSQLVANQNQQNLNDAAQLAAIQAVDDTLAKEDTLQEIAQTLEDNLEPPVEPDPTDTIDITAEQADLATMEGELATAQTKLDEVQAALEEAEEGFEGSDEDFSTYTDMLPSTFDPNVITSPGGYATALTIPVPEWAFDTSEMQVSLVPYQGAIDIWRSIMTWLIRMIGFAATVMILRGAVA
jgi:hypothetical protein